MEYLAKSDVVSLERSSMFQSQVSTALGEKSFTMRELRFLPFW